MINGLTFNGKHSYNDFGLYMKSDNRTLLPGLRRREIVIDGKNGTWDFGNNTYDNRVISVRFTLITLSRTELRVKARRIAQWLNNPNPALLIFDDEIDKEYVARIYDPISLDEIINNGEFTVNFSCQPLARLIYNANDIILDTDIMLDTTDIRLGDTYSYTVTQYTQFEINNFGTYQVRPVITITGSFSSLTIIVNGKTLNYTEAVSNDVVTIDNENYTVKKSETNKLPVVTGDVNKFLVLEPGINTVTIDGVNLNCTVDFIFKPQYL